MVRIHFTVNPRFPQLCSSTVGKSDPKARPKGVVDGKQVKIPVLEISAMAGRRLESQPSVGLEGVSW